MNPEHFRRYVIRPTLEYLGMWSAGAENLMLATAMVESDLQWLAQHGGPALGPYQIEPATHQDIWNSVLKYRHSIREKVERLLADEPERLGQLQTNLAYSTAIARLCYWRWPDPIPDPADVDGMWRLYKTRFNTALGATTEGRFVSVYSQIIGG